MKIDVYLVTCNDNPEYYSFYPKIKIIWEKLLSIKCILIFIGNILPDILKPYKEDIIIFNPIHNINTVFIAQNIRLLYPCIMEKYQNGILIGDIDAIPLNKNYFIDNIKEYPDDFFITYGFAHALDSVKERQMSYNVALQKTWSEIFGIKNIDDINNKLIHWYKMVGVYKYNPKFRSKCIGFHFDQKILYQSLHSWNKKETNLKYANKNNLQRLGSAKSIENLSSIVNTIYFDFFKLRPYKKNVQFLNKLITVINSMDAT